MCDYNTINNIEKVHIQLDYIKNLKTFIKTKQFYYEINK